MLPYMLQFFATFGTNQVENMIAVNEYMGFVLELVLISGLIFELRLASPFAPKQTSRNWLFVLPNDCWPGALDAAFIVRNALGV